MNNVACLGKIPTHGEFLHVRASSPTMRSLDRWIRTGLYHARQNRPPDWEDAYDDSSIRRFLFWGEESSRPSAVLGVLCPSRDSGGRIYPLLITCEVSRRRLRAEHCAYLPLYAASFFEAAEQVGRTAVAGHLSSDQVTERVKALSQVSVSPSVPREHRRYLQSETTGSFLRALFGRFGDSRKYRFFSSLFDAVRQGSDGAWSSERGLLFPLSGRGAAPETEVSFWADLVGRLRGDRGSATTCFWTARASKPTSGQLLFYLGVPGPPALLDVLCPGRAQGRIVRLQKAECRRAVEPALSIPETYGDVLETEHLRLWDFLRRFRSVPQ